MKTKFKSLFAVALAAATFASCSNEVETPENGAMLNPGDAQITINLKGATTYSTETLEKMIKNGSGRLFKAGGDPIVLKDAKIDAKQFTATITAGSFVEGDKANLYLYANSTPSAAIGAKETGFAASTTNVLLDRAILNGLPAGSAPIALTLKSGIIASPIADLKLVRAAARVAAKSAIAGMSVKDYTIALNNVNITSGRLFTDTITAGKDKVAARALDGITTDMYNGTETVAYVYPSSGAEVVVTAPTSAGGGSKTLTFSPKRGKNYVVNITPVKSEDASLTWDVAISEWDPADENIDANFGGETKVTLPAGVIAGFVGNKDGKLEIDAKTASADLVTTVGVPLTAEQLLGKAISDKEASFSVPTTTRAAGGFVSTDRKLAVSATAKKITISALPNHSKPVEYTIEVTGATTKTKYLVGIVVNGLGYQPHFVTSFNGFEVMQMAVVNGGLDATNTVLAELEIAYKEDIAATSIYNGVIASGDYFNRVGGKMATNTCPKGFRMLQNKEELMKFLGMTTWTLSAEKAVAAGSNPVVAGATVKLRSGSTKHGAANTHHAAILETAAAEQIALVSDETIHTADGFFFQFRSANKYSIGEKSTSQNLRCVKDSFK